MAAAHLVQGRQLLKAPTSLLLASYFLRRGPKTQGQPGRSLVEKHKKGSIKSAQSASGMQGHVTGAGPGPPASPEEQLPGFTFHAQDRSGRSYTQIHRRRGRARERQRAQSLKVQVRIPGAALSLTSCVTLSESLPLSDDNDNNNSYHLLRIYLL